MNVMVNFVCAFILVVNVSSAALTDDATTGQNNPDQASVPELKASDELKKLIAAIRLEEDRYQDYVATVRTSQELDSSDPNQDDLQGTARISISHLTIHVRKRPCGRVVIGRSNHKTLANGV